MKIIKKIAINLGIAVLTVAFFALLLELFVRTFVPNRAMTPGTYISHPARRYALRPNSSGFTYGHPYKINSHGLRDHEYGYKKDKGVFRILSIGDSCTFGIGVDLEDTYPKQLEKLLKNEYPSKDIEVINTGVPSYNTLCEYLYLTEEGMKYDPDLIIIAYIDNDSVHNYPITSSRNKLLNLAKDILRYSYSYEFILDKVYRANYKLRGLVKNDPGVRRDNLRYVYSDEYIGWRENKEVFAGIRKLSVERGVPVVYVIFPRFEKFGDYPYEFYHRIIKDALKDEPYVLDLLPFFKGRDAKSFWVTDFDPHPNREGNRIIVDAIGGYLGEKGLINPKAR